MEIKNKIDNEKEKEILHVFCSNEVHVETRVTFCARMLGKLRVTHWLEDSDITDGERVNKMFDILFAEVEIRRKNGSILSIKK